MMRSGSSNTVAPEACASRESEAIFTHTDGHARQDDVARASGGQEHGAVLGRACFERRPVGDDGVGEEQRRDLP